MSACRTRPGDQLVAPIRAVLPELPIVIATGFSETEFGRRFQDDERVRVIGKPFDAPQLWSVLGALDPVFIEPRLHLNADGGNLRRNRGVAADQCEQSRHPSIIGRRSATASTWCSSSRTRKPSSNPSTGSSAAAARQERRHRHRLA